MILVIIGTTILIGVGIARIVSPALVTAMPLVSLFLVVFGFILQMAGAYQIRPSKKIPPLNF